MKKNLSKLKFAALALGLMLVATVTNAADRYVVAAGGNWNSTSTWSTSLNGVGGASVPGSMDAVIISAARNLTVTTGTVTCASITFTIDLTTSTGGTLTVDAGAILNTGAIVKNNATQTASVNNIAGAGTINCTSFTVGGTGTTVNATHLISILSTITALNISGDLLLRGEDDGANDQNSTFNIASGIVTVGGTVNTDEENGSTVTLSLNTGAETGTLVFTGTTPFTNTVGTLTFDPAGSSATVEFARAGNQTIPVFAYTNLGISGSGVKSLAGDINISGNLDVATGGTLTLGANDLTINVNGVRTANIAGTLNIDGNGRLAEGGNSNKTLLLTAGSFLNITDLGTTGVPILNLYDFDPASTVVFGATDAQTIENSITYGNLTVSGGNTKTLENSGGTMTFAGSIVIVAGTTLDANDKTLNVGGNFIKNGAFTQANTTLVLNGTAAQSLRGSTAIDLNNLTINNAIAGSVVAVIVDTIVNIAGAATFTDGIVSTSTTEYLSFADGATATGTGLSQTTDASFVVGPVRKTGNDGFIFPVGALVTAAGGGYMPLTISAPNELGDIFSCEYTRNNATLVQTNGYTAPIINVSRCDYWNLNEVADPSNNNSISVTLSWDAGSACNTNTFINNYLALTVAHYNSTNSKWEQAGTGGPIPSGSNATGTVTRTGVSVFSPFSLGNTLVDANPLPVTFSDVKAFAKGTGVQLEWTNLTEKDLVNYTIERSSNGVVFSAISSVAARSNNNDKESYSGFDAVPFSGTNFYRIKTVETDGKIAYSKLMKVDIGRTVKGIALYPNPVVGTDLSINLTTVKGQFNLVVYNNAGQQVYAKQLNLAGGNVSQSVELPASLKTGVYNLVISGDNYKETKTFILQ